MKKKKENIYSCPNIPGPGHPVIFDPTVCKGCNTCVDACQMDVFIPNPEKGKPPIPLFPDECWYCGSCVERCPVSGAIKFNHPLMQRVHWRRKTTGEDFWV